MVERMLADFSVPHGLRSIALRYFNAAGADPDGEIGEDHDPETHLIPLTLNAASGQGTGLTIFGTDYDTPDGTCMRDYIHVTDLADTHVRALRALETGAASDIFNLGNGHGFSVVEVIQAVELATEVKVPVQRGPRRAGDTAALISDATKSRDDLGWQPQIAGLAEIVRTAWARHRPAESVALRKGQTAVP
jgi:UDP-arabinose 4-epimerase